MDIYTKLKPYASNLHYLKRYVNFIFNSAYSQGEEHHILPKAMFPEYINEEWNKTILSMRAHYIAHRLLFKALRNQKMTCAYKFMSNRGLYTSSDYALLKDEYSKVMSNHFKALWADPEWRKNVISIMIAERATPEGRERMINAANKRWDSLSEMDRIAFRKKMQLINEDEDKRKDASKKLKALWADPEYKEKMKDRKHGSNSSSLKEKWADPEWRAMMLQKRKEAHERKKLQS